MSLVTLNIHDWNVKCKTWPHWELENVLPSKYCKEAAGVTDVTACGCGQYVPVRILSLSPACLSDDACAAKIFRSKAYQQTKVRSQR